MLVEYYSAIVAKILYDSFVKFKNRRKNFEHEIDFELLINELENQ